MKKINLNSAKLQLKKDKIVNLTDSEMQQFQGGKTATGQTPCLPPSAYTQPLGQCTLGCPPSADCTNGVDCQTVAVGCSVISCEAQFCGSV